MTIDDLKAEVAATARMMAAAGLVEGFGHASARLPDGGFLISSTSPLFQTTADTILTVDEFATVTDAPAGAPLEIPMHAGVYRARPDVNAVCRGHGAAMAAWGVREGNVPLLHGMGGLAGEVVPTHPDLKLITTLAEGDEVAATLGNNQALLLWANGGLAVGADLVEAATRLWYLEERCRVAAEAGEVRQPDGKWPERLASSAPELVRAKAWFQARFTTD